MWIKFETLKVNELISPNILLCFLLILIPYLRLLLWRTEKWQKFRFVQRQLPHLIASTTNGTKDRNEVIQQNAKMNSYRRTNETNSNNKNTKMNSYRKANKSCTHRYRRTNEKLTHTEEQTKNKLTQENKQKWADTEEHTKT